MEIAQLIFANMSSPPEGDYKKTGRYNEKNWTSYEAKE